MSPEGVSPQQPLEKVKIWLSNSERHYVDNALSYLQNKFKYNLSNLLTTSKVEPQNAGKGNSSLEDAIAWNLQGSIKCILLS